MLPTLGLCLTILWQGALPESTAPKEESQSGRPRVAIRGRVVDDETGAPIESFTLESGRLKGQDPAETAWGVPPERPERLHDREWEAGRDGRQPPRRVCVTPWKSARMGSRHQGWLRVLADGYEPRPVTDRPPGPTDAGKTIEVTVRLRRGRPLAGRVLDHAGRPAGGAKLFLIRPSGGTVRVVDDVIGEGSDTGLARPVRHAGGGR